MLFPVDTGLSVLLGWGGWYSAARLKVPAASLLGPMILVGAAAALGLIHVDSPFWLKNVLQIVVGAFLGYSVDRTAIRRIRSMLKPITFATAWLILSALLIGHVLSLITQVDSVTAFLGTSPGGIAEMSAMAMSSRANVALVATLQTFRIIATTLAIPFLARSMAGPGAPAEPRPLRKDLASAPSPVNSLTSSDRKPLSWLVCISLGAAGSLIFTWLRVPAAGILGSMIFVAGGRIALGDIERPPAKLRTVAQVGLGILIGTTFNEQTVLQLQQEFLVVALVTAATVVSSLGLAGLVRRSLHVDAQTALLACAPGGLTQMGIVADELGAQVFVVNVFQLARMICAVLILPMVVSQLK